ncbi:MAG: hypothetical protein R8K47_04430 [Mariprofundaceae bacterium]
MMRWRWLLACVAAVVLAEPAAAMVWQPVPQKVDHAHRRSAPKLFVLQDGDGASVRMVRPDLSKQPLRPEADGRFVVRPTGIEFYHALVAEREHNGVHENAIRYFAMFGRPSGKSPSDLLAMPKAALEIVPDPLPREHWRYMAHHPARFRIRFQGRPLANAIVSLRTNHGTRLDAETDAGGIVEFLLPDDFPATKPGWRNNAPGEFVVQAAFESGGKRYASTLSAAYTVDPAHWQSRSGGAAIAFAGGLAGLLIGLRRRSGKNEQRKKEGSR